jgi:flagellar biosynthesis protein FlhB
MAEQEQNRTEAATPHKLKEAKKRGAVAKSTDLNSLFVIAGLVGFLYLMGWTTAKRQLSMDVAILSQAHLINFSLEQITPWLTQLLVDSVTLLAPFFLTLMVLGTLANLIQTGPIFSFDPLKPDFNRLNLATGFKRLFSLRQLFDLGKTLFKLTIFIWVIYFSIRHLFGPMLGLLHTDPAIYAKRAIDDAAGLIFKMLLAMLFIALIDLLFTRWDYSKKQMMSRRELKDEIKQREGDPRIKARIRELQNEMRKRSKSLRNIPKADVLITNPTHIAVAIMYRHGEMQTPTVVAKGAGKLVVKMKAVARKHRVTIIENRTLAHALYKADFEAPIPDGCYAEVAKLLAWVYAQRDMRNAAERPT